MSNAADMSWGLLIWFYSLPSSDITIQRLGVREKANLQICGSKAYLLTCCADYVRCGFLPPLLRYNRYSWDSEHSYTGYTKSQSFSRCKNVQCLIDQTNLISGDQKKVKLKQRTIKTGIYLVATGPVTEMSIQKTYNYVTFILVPSTSAKDKSLKIKSQSNKFCLIFSI